jgi:prepilin-type N-terminal cleavage/methylation domain-containing protein
MKTALLRKDEKGFTLIEIIAVLVILGILAAVAIPKYIDMREDAVKKAVVGVSSELNARERLTLAQWKLQDKSGNYTAPDTVLGPDWNGGAAIASGTGFQYQGKTITCTRTAQTTENEPASWACAVSAGT